MKPQLTLVVLACAIGLGAGGCRQSLSERRVRAVDEGALMKRDLRSYHVVYSEHRGPVGYMKVYDVVEAGGAAFPWRYVYDSSLRELGWIDQYGKAFRYHYYPVRATPVGTEPLRVIAMPEDSIQRNTMRMLGIDPATDNVSFPLATEADIDPPAPPRPASAAPAAPDAGVPGAQ